MPDTSLTLISNPLCPFVQRAAIVLLEKGVPFERMNVDLTGKPDWFLALSPTGKVPLLKVRQADGTEAILFESMVICEYLEETQDGAPMYPDDALLRAKLRSWIEFANQIYADAWQFLNGRDHATADTKKAAFQARFQRWRRCLDRGPTSTVTHSQWSTPCSRLSSGISTSSIRLYRSKSSRTCPESRRGG